MNWWTRTPCWPAWNGSELFAVLDVTTPWVLPADSGFYTHPNVLLTPHLAGSLGTELERMAATPWPRPTVFPGASRCASPSSVEDLAFTA